MNSHDYICKQIQQETEKAGKKFGWIFLSSHEAYAVLKEEVDEYWQEVKHGSKERERAELLQVAAMALKAIYTIDNIEEITHVEFEDNATDIR